ncbi:MAG: NADH-quinone oxidoreductase subunit G [Polynucleobacter sp. 24-46-87]|jgi:NADH-quinone oxidoreductase subunit G|uniref:NADH-quinone oxidoreductase subunit NuoG n=1 Tax=unclassified Polynucleobacter TaxID=2640945 RepID=UPI000BCD2811|nr:MULTISPECIES: NADH-quinone oxidoreductase subunit NuoG [unclassified Polynucleobacter]OYY20989.1 MAG: NADH-quinone oxidoreductase subunit G [Polynucleobacter sp. 35-46-11]OZA15937.1 MAG: NADH-quinone oxidoreductase subunit G [Polynucleobacter sp. 24-46-87]OZA78255.1 MAG: NADH-quinone oxidoreductase subunit G [Polynucleobacter sp. 39-46-10]
MVEIELDGKAVEVPQGSMVMHAANKLGTYIPHFCYHKKLSIAANCRMCLVEVEKAPKPLPACATPVTQGMKVFTHSAKAVEAQRSVMEFLLINHPLDCPICDQGGECQLQDLAVGYGKSNSRYEEDKRVVFHKNVGPLISMQEMTRCIHCTRCVRFGQEVAGVMELGMVNRGEHSEITTFAGQTIDSELSGNMIDLCPVGALTSKPFRYAARTWELGRKRSVSPHDSLGANTTIQTKANKVMRVVALENDAINECWISDRDRFAYEGLNSADRVTTPMVKQGGQWLETDWQSAMDYVAHSLKTISSENGPEAVAALAHPISSTEELYLLQKMIRGLGSKQVETRLRQTDVKGAASTPWLGMSISKVSELDRVLVIGSFLRKEQPLIATRLRAGAKRGLQVLRIDAGGDDWLIPNTGIAATPSAWLNTLSEVALAVAKAKSATAPAGTPNLTVSATAQKIADSLLSGACSSVLLGSAAIAHPQASDLHILAQFIAEQAGATLGFLPVGGNAVGASLVNANGAGVESVLSGDHRAVILMNIEPDADLPNPTQARAALAKANTVIVLSAYKSADLLEVADVILPISTFTETVSTFVNSEGRAQTIQPAVKPLGDSRPAWKVLRVLGGLLGLDGFLYNMPEEVLGEALGENYCAKLSNQSTAAGLTNLANGNAGSSAGLERISDVGIYAGDQIVRRSSALQLTRDAKRGNQVGLGQVLFNELGLKEGDAVRVTQGSHSVDLPVTLEANLAKDAVRISAGTMASAKLGSMFGPVTVSKA